ncbi:sodium-dependent proline transporter [Caerostris extrusa]|uniref:Transporter n=1 Tax=Caerostris extrusa TaxID=172846 RepID=A0AAV4QFF9_CAEEX|nr:sodium-dependent proline transporter [Caerostris extrusa]
MYNFLKGREGFVLDPLDEEYEECNSQIFKRIHSPLENPLKMYNHKVSSLQLEDFYENELDKEFPRVNSQVPLSPRGDEDDRSYQYSEAEAERGTWTGKFDFLLSLLGYSVGLGNVWRFPYLCYSNGGGAFLIPFVCMMLLAGLPLMFMELSFGQYASLGPIAIFDRFCPLFAGLGYGMVIVSGTVMLYYNMIIAWTIFYMIASWNSRLPWEHCAPEWSTSEDFKRVTTTNLPQPSLRQRTRPRKPKNKNRQGGRNIERYVQRVESSDGVVAVPVNPVWKRQPTTNAPVREVVVDQRQSSAYSNNVDSITTWPAFETFESSNKNLATQIAYPLLYSTYPTQSPFVVQKTSYPPNSFSTLPKPTVKVYEAEVYDSSPIFKPYSFGYDVFDGYGTKQYRQESTSGDGVVRGNYGYKDFQGIYRQVEYTADKDGFHAVLKSNEPGLANVDTGDVLVSVDPPPIAWPSSDSETPKSY